MMKLLPHHSAAWMLSLASCAILSITAVSCKRPERREAPQTTSQTTTESGAPIVQGKVKGALLNAFFPKDDGDWDVIYTQEKEGFAQAKLENGGKEVATLSVSDFSQNTEAIAMYEASKSEIGGLPAMAKGKKGTTLLTGRFQVSVRSKDDSFTEADRKAWIQKFDLDGLAALAN